MEGDANSNKKQGWYVTYLNLMRPHEHVVLSLSTAGGLMNDIVGKTIAIKKTKHIALDLMVTALYTRRQ